MRKILLIVLIPLITVMLCGSKSTQFVINAEANATMHNNLGLRCIEEKYYYGAIKEFEIAIKLNPNTQVSSVYYNNLGRTYMKINYPNLAEEQFVKAIEKNPLNFEFYKNLTEAYISQNIIEKKLEEYKADRKSKYDDIIISLLYGALGYFQTEITMLDEFCNEEPDLIITPAIRKYCRERAYYINLNENLKDSVESEENKEDEENNQNKE